MMDEVSNVYWMFIELTYWIHSIIHPGYSLHIYVSHELASDSLILLLTFLFKLELGALLRLEEVLYKFVNDSASFSY